MGWAGEGGDAWVSGGGIYWGLNLVVMLSYQLFASEYLSCGGQLAIGGGWWEEGEADSQRIFQNGSGSEGGFGTKGFDFGVSEPAVGIDFDNTAAVGIGSGCGGCGRFDDDGFVLGGGDPSVGRVGTELGFSVGEDGVNGGGVAVCQAPVRGGVAHQDFQAIGELRGGVDGQDNLLGLGDLADVPEYDGNIGSADAFNTLVDQQLVGFRW